MTITVGEIEGGYAYWCDDCHKRRAAKLGIRQVDLQNAYTMADWHHFDHHPDEPRAL